GDFATDLVGLVLGLIVDPVFTEGLRVDLKSIERATTVAGAEPLGVKLKLEVVPGQIQIVIVEAGGEHLVTGGFTLRIAFFGGGGRPVSSNAILDDIVVIPF